MSVKKKSFVGWKTKMKTREILEELVSHYASKDEEGEYWGYDTSCGKGEAITTALLSLKSVILECLPEEKNKEFAKKDLEKAMLPNVIRLLATQVGYNKAITQIKENMEKLFFVAKEK